MIINKILRQLLCSGLFCSVLGIFNKITRQLDHAYVNAIEVPGDLFWFGIIDLECICAHVMCHMYKFFFSFLGQSGEAYRWRVYYQQGLPSLVLPGTVIQIIN